MRIAMYEDVRNMKLYQNNMIQIFNVVTYKEKAKALAIFKEFEHMQVPLNNGHPDWRIGNMNKPATFIYVLFNSFVPIVIEGVEEPFSSRSFTELMNDYNERLSSDIKKVLVVKPLFKARLRLHMWITGVQETTNSKLIGKTF